MFLRSFKTGVNFVRIVAAACQTPDVIVRHVGHQLEQLGMLAKEMFAHIGAIFRFVVLVFAVDCFHHHALQDAFFIACE